MSSYGDWENSCLCLEDGMKPAAANLINLQSIYNQCLGEFNMVSDEQINYCKCGCGQEVKPGNVFIHGHNGRCASAETRKKISEAHKGNQYNLGRKHTDEHNKKMSEMFKGKNAPNYGKVMSDEQKRKISLSRRGKCVGEDNPFYGKKHTEETRLKISKAKKGKYAGENCYWYGKQRSEEDIKKMSDSHLGKTLTEEHKEKISGKNNHGWLGGVSFEPYCHKFNEDIKEKVRDEYNRLCFLCDKTESDNGKKLAVHHVTYDKQQGCNGNNFKLIPLCSSCHAKTNHDREYWEQVFNDKLTQLQELTKT